MSEPTPGPWRHLHDGHGAYSIETNGGVQVCYVRAEANAHLIAAAPESHEANKLALMVLCALEKANDWHPNMQKDIAFAIEANRAAIAAATGEQP